MEMEYYGWRPPGWSALIETRDKIFDWSTGVGKNIGEIAGETQKTVFLILFMPIILISSIIFALTIAIIGKAVGKINKKKEDETND